LLIACCPDCPDWLDEADDGSEADDEDDDPSPELDPLVPPDAPLELPPAPDDDDCANVVPPRHIEAANIVAQRIRRSIKHVLSCCPTGRRARLFLPATTRENILPARTTVVDP